MTGSSPVAVIGAGNVGCALAADLALRGAEVRLFNRSPGRLAAIADAGGITVTGVLEGSAALMPAGIQNGPDFEPVKRGAQMAARWPVRLPAAQIGTK